MDKNFRSFDICGNIRRACARIRGVPQKKVGLRRFSKWRLFYGRHFLFSEFFNAWLLVIFCAKYCVLFFAKKIPAFRRDFLNFVFLMQGILKSEHAFRGLFCYLFFAYPYGASAMVKFKAESVGDFARA